MVAERGSTVDAKAVENVACLRTKRRGPKIARTVSKRSNSKSPKQRTNFTRARRKLLGLIDEENPPQRNEVQNGCQRPGSSSEPALSIMGNLSKEYLHQGDRYHWKRVEREIELLENEFTEVQNGAQEYLDKTRSDFSTSEKSALIETESDCRKEIGKAPHPDCRDRREWPRNSYKGRHLVSRGLRNHTEWLRNLHEGERSFQEDGKTPSVHLDTVTVL